MEHCDSVRGIPIGRRARRIHLRSHAGWHTRIPAGAPMTATEADENERVFLERARKAYLELVDEMKRQPPAPIPQYPRD